jgi:hypothetical protein
MPAADMTVTSTRGPAGADMSQAIMIILRLFRGLECVDTGLTPSQYRIMKLAGAGISSGGAPPAGISGPRLADARISYAGLTVS